jgi:uncharacterized protein DUF5318
MRTQRQIVDYSLQRRSLLRELYAGRVGTSEVCDASHYLLSAARFHGDSTEQRCPVCRREYLIRVHYVYGEELKAPSGQARRRAELPALAGASQEIRVYGVEVCRGCGWNYLVEQFLIGEPEPVAAAGHPPPNSGADSRRLRGLAQRLDPRPRLPLTGKV